MLPRIFFFLPCGPPFCIKMSGTHLYLLIVVLETARFSVDEALQTLVSTFMLSVVLQCSLILRD